MLHDKMTPTTYCAQDTAGNGAGTTTNAWMPLQRHSHVTRPRGSMNTGFEIVCTLISVIVSVRSSPTHRVRSRSVKLPLSDSRTARVVRQRRQGGSRTGARNRFERGAHALTRQHAVAGQQAIRGCSTNRHIRHPSLVASSPDRIAHERAAR